MKSASKEAVGLVQSIDLRKPIVKEFVDQDQEVINFLSIRLPHVPYCTSKMICVYRSKDKTEVAYRVNWYKKEEGIVVQTNRLHFSPYVKVLIKPGGVFEIVK